MEQVSTVSSENLPHEVLMNVMSHVPPKELGCAVTLVCKRWQACADANPVWGAHFPQYAGRESVKGAAWSAVMGRRREARLISNTFSLKQTALSLGARAFLKAMPLNQRDFSGWAVQGNAHVAVWDLHSGASVDLRHLEDPARCPFLSGPVLFGERDSLALFWFGGEIDIYGVGSWNEPLAKLKLDDDLKQYDRKRSFIVSHRESYFVAATSHLDRVTAWKLGNLENTGEPVQGRRLFSGETLSHLVGKESRGSQLVGCQRQGRPSVAALTDRGKVVIWDLSSEGSIFSFDTESCSKLRCFDSLAVVSPQGASSDRIIAPWRDSIAVWDIESGEPLMSIKPGLWIRELVAHIRPDGEIFAAGFNQDSKACFRIFDFATGMVHKDQSENRYPAFTFMETGVHLWAFAVMNTQGGGFLMRRWCLTENRSEGLLDRYKSSSIGAKDEFQKEDTFSLTSFPHPEGFDDLLIAQIGVNSELDITLRSWNFGMEGDGIPTPPASRTPVKKEEKTCVLS